jgi:isocitrate dehydrogenase
MDALMARIVQFPEEFDVIVTENLSGDYLSDLTAEEPGILSIDGKRFQRFTWGSGAFETRRPSVS